MRNQSPQRKLFTWLFGAILICLTLLAPLAQAACPETIGTTTPIVYQDCVEVIDVNPGTPDSLVVATSGNTQIGDYQVLVVVRKSTSNSSVITTPAGWTAIMASTRNSATNGSNDVVMGVYAKTATAAGAENVTVATNNMGSATNDLLIWIMRFSNTLGHDTNAGANATNAPAANATVTSLGITTTQDYSLVLRLAGIDDDDQANANDTSPIFGDTTITLEETAASNNSATGIATRDLQVAAGASGNATFANGGAEEWITRTFALLPRPYFTLTVPATGNTCQTNAIVIEARNTNGTVNAGYTGTITLDTSTGLGDWSTVGGDANGTLNNGTANDGAATYTFVAGDSGTITLMYSSATAGSVNFNIVDGSSHRELKTPANDSNLTLSACPFFTIAHAGTGGICTATAVTISATDPALVIQPGYTGNIQLSAGGSGNWSAPGANGTFSNGTADDGIATYTYVPADNGQVVFYFTPGGMGTVNFNVQDLGDPARPVHPSADPDLIVENCEYRISHDLSGNNCSKEAITFSVVTTSGVAISNYAGTLNLTVTSAAADKGTWSLPLTETGTLTETTIKDGIASYLFPPVNDGTITLDLAATEMGTFNFNVSGGGYPTNAGFDPTLTVTACKFRVAYTGGNSTDVCSYKEAILSVVDGNNIAVTNFTGPVNITTTSNKGTWQENGVQPGTLTDLFDNDGSASYTFVAADAGDVALLLNVPEVGTGTLKVDVETAGGGVTVDPNPTYDPDLTVALCTFRIVLADGDMSSCSVESVTLSVYNSNNVLAVDYEGTVDFTTLNGNGTWLLGTGSGTLFDPVAEDGEASYTFGAADDGVAVFNFLDGTAETTNIDAIDELEANFRESALYDPSLSVLPCLPTVFASQCYNYTEAMINNAITIPAEVPGLESRMLLMYMFTPSSTAPVAPTLSQGPYSQAMTLIRSQTVANARMEVWGILGANLPDTAGALNYFMGGTWNGATDPGVCLVAVENVEQVLPLATVPPQNGPLNGIASTSLTNSTLGLTATANNSLIISSIGTATDAATGIASSLGTVLWDLNSGAPTAPDSSNFNAYYEVKPVASAVSVTETTGGTISDVAHTALVLAPRVAGNPYASGYVPVLLFDTLAGNLSYRAIGKSLRALPNPLTAPYTNACVMNPSSASVLDLPPGSTIETAYLYWAGSGETAQIDSVVNFGRTGFEVPVTAQATFQVLDVGNAGNLDFFVGYKDVTLLIDGSQTAQEYTLGGLTVQTGAPWVTTSACLGGWGLVVVFENATYEPFVNVINLFHGFQPFQNSSVTLVPRNFRMAYPNALTNVPRGIITHITFEGDDTLNSGSEVFELQNDPLTLTFEALTNPYNLGTAQYNDTVTFPDYYSPTTPKPYIAQSTTSYGTDVDTYYIAGPVASAADSKEDILYPFGLNEAEQITTRYSAGQDLVLLTGEFIAVTNADLADMEMFVTTAGTFKANSVGTGSLFFDVTNNGNNAASNGFATGTVILSGILPAGLTLNTLNADPQWACVTTSSTFRCTFNIESWTAGTWNPGLSVYQLDDGASLPQVEITVNVGDEVYFPLLNNTAYMSGRIAHFKTPLDCSFVGIPNGEQPDPATCSKANQFDNVNDLNKNTIDIDDLDVKQVNNNNVDRGTINISGIRTDLQLDISVTGVLQQGEPAQYQLLVTNNGPDATTKVMTVSASFDPDAAPADGVFVVTGWSCTVSSASMTCTSTAPIASGGSSPILVSIPVVNKAEGEFASVSAAVTPGTYNFDTTLTNNADTLNSEVVGLIVPISEKFLLSVTEAATLGANTVSFGPEDLVLFDPSNNQAELFLDTSTLGGVTDIDAVHLLPNGWIVFSADGAGTFLTVAYEDEDLLLYDPILGTATLLFDGSDANKFNTGATAANIDALHIATNASWDASNWDIYISTTASSNLPGVGAFEDKDIVVYDMGTGTAAMFFDGSDANKFAAGVGDIDGFFIPYDDPALYYLTASDATATIDTNETFERDDLVTYDTAQPDGNKALQVFDGEQSDGFTPLPISATLGIDALHVVQEGYYGHFAVSTVDGDTCNAGTVTIRKHAGLGHTIETTYKGSIRLTESTGTGTWVLGGTANGTLNNLGGGVAIYTFHADDNGEVELLLGNTVESANVNINVTNKIAHEAVAEDSLIDITLSLLPVEYLDTFTFAAFSNNNGNTVWSSSWSEVNDNNSATTGDIFVTTDTKRLRLRDSNGDFPYVSRSINFNYAADTDVILNFKWNRDGGTISDSFVVEYNLNNAGWTLLNTYGNASSGVVNQTAASINLTAAGVTGLDGDTLMLRFRVNSGLLLQYVEIDDIQVTTSTASDCNPGVPLDHYHITHGGSTVSCLAENITITGHDSLHNPINPGAGVVLELATGSPGSYWNQPVAGTGQLLPLLPVNTGVATYTFPANESVVTLPFNFTNIYPPTNSVAINFSAMSTVGVVEPDYVTTPLTVNRAGIRFLNFTDSNQVLPNLMAGADSLAYSGKQLILQVIQALPENPAACTPLVGVGESADIQLVVECTDPGTCSDVGLQAAITHKDGAGTATTAINTLDSNSSSWISNEAEFLSLPQRLEFEDFGGNPGAYIRVVYPDVGDIQLHARYNVPLSNDSTAAAGLSADYIHGSSSTNFRVRPFALDIDFSDGRSTNGTGDVSYAANAAGSAFGMAGVAEPVTVSAVIYDAADDLNTDWVPDVTADLSNNAITANFGNESWFDYKVQLSLMTDDPNTPAEDPVPGVPKAAVPTVGPSVGVVGVLTQDVDFTNFTAGRSNGNITFDEVGIIDIRAELRNVSDSNLSSYGGNTGAVVGGVLNVGRFTPAYFDLEMPATLLNTYINERPNAGDAAAFTYMGEQFDVILALQAFNFANDLTLNYFGDFARFTNFANGSPQFVFRALEDNAGGADVDWSNPLTPDTDRLSDITNLAYDSLWANGEAVVSGKLVFNRETDSGTPGQVPDGPLSLDIAVRLEDADGVRDQSDVNIDAGNEADPFTHSYVDTNEFRYGRLVLLNAYGSELPNLDGDNIGKDVGMRMIAEYWDSTAGNWVTNADDDGSAFDIVHLKPVAGTYDGQLADGELNKTAGISTLTGGLTSETGTTDQPFYFAAPGEGNEGSVLMEYDLSASGANMGFLTYDWRSVGETEDETADNDYSDSPRALLEFGVFRGSSRIINWQELFINEQP